MRISDWSSDVCSSICWTAGLDFEPRFLSGVKLNLTWFDIRYRDRIATATSFLQQFLVRRDIYGGLIDDSPDPAVVASYFADPSFSNPIGIGQGEVMAIVDSRTRTPSRPAERPGGTEGGRTLR